MSQVLLLSFIFLFLFIQSPPQTHSAGKAVFCLTVMSEATEKQARNGKVISDEIIIIHYFNHFAQSYLWQKALSECY